MCGIISQIFMYAFLAFPKMGEFQILAIPLVSQSLLTLMEIISGFISDDRFRFF
jgi:hypothetical protein